MRGSCGGRWKEGREGGRERGVDRPQVPLIKANLSGPPLSYRHTGPFFLPCDAWSSSTAPWHNELCSHTLNALQDRLHTAIMSTPAHRFASPQTRCGHHGLFAKKKKKTLPWRHPSSWWDYAPLPRLAGVAGGPFGLVVMVLLVCGGGRDGPEPRLRHQSLHTEAWVKGRGGERGRHGTPRMARRVKTEDWRLECPGRRRERKKKEEKEQIIV